MLVCPKCGSQLDEDVLYCTFCGIKLPVPNSIPAFSPPADNAPSIPPASESAITSPVCYHHQNKPAVTQCARCGRYMCRDCTDAYTVDSGEYANKCLCYDCCQTLAAENVEALKSQKKKIITLFVATIIGMIAGGILFSTFGSIYDILFGILWGGSFWAWVKLSFLSWLNNPSGLSLKGFTETCIFGAIAAPFKTLIKIIQCIKFLMNTSKSTEKDSAALQQITDHMAYTEVVSRNAGENLETLLAQGSELHDNSYAQMIHTQGKAAADAALRQCTTTIAANSETINSFVA